MLHIPLLITFSAFLIAQPLYSMEPEKKEKKLPPLPLRKKSDDSSSPKQKHTPYRSNDQDHIPSISLTTSSTSMSVDIEVSQPQSSKQSSYTRSKTVDTTPIQPKEHHKFNIFAHSESAGKEKTSKQKGYGRSKTVDTASTQPREQYKPKMLSVSDGETSFSSFSSLKISPRSKLISSAKTIPQAKINILTNAVQNYDLDTVQQHCDNPDANLNQTDQKGNTALHHAVIKLTETTSNEAMLKKFIKLFLENPRIDTSIIRHEDNRTASQILLGGQNPEMRAVLFARLTLDMTTNQEIAKMLIESYIYDILLDDNLIKKTVEYIKNKIQLTEKKQGGSDLPQEATLPNYASNEFIFTMIESRIPKEAYNVSDLQKSTLKNIFFKQRDSIVLLKIPMDFYNPSIEDSIKEILTIINKYHNYLSKLITKPCIFEMLKTYVEKQNEENKPKDFLKFYSTNNNNNNNNNNNY